MKKHFAFLVLAILISSSAVLADETGYAQSQVRGAIERAIPMLEAGSAGSSEQRTCFTCHNQALPILALTAAKERSFAIDEANLGRQLEHTRAHLERGKSGYLEGKGQGGKSVTAGYALWALQAGGHAADETTTAVAGYLLQDQLPAGNWSHPGSRPPSSGSDLTTTSVALRGITAYGSPDLKSEIDECRERVRGWLAKTEPQDTEDRVFRLHALRAIDAEGQLREAVADLLSNQRENGGWGQTCDMPSDAYATGSALVALAQAGRLPFSNQALQRGIRYLLDTQLEDGTWQVATRAKPFQTYYESGFPHGKDQFISIAASSWATLALVLALDEP